MAADAQMGKLLEGSTRKCTMIGMLQALIMLGLWSAARSFDADSSVVLLPAKWPTMLATGAFSWGCFTLTNMLYHWWRESDAVKAATVLRADRNDLNEKYQALLLTLDKIGIGVRDPQHLNLNRPDLLEAFLQERASGPTSKDGTAP